MNGRGRASITFLVGLVGVLMGAAFVWFAAGLTTAGPGRVRLGGPAGPPTPVSRQSQDAITAAVARAGPAVVNINTLVQPRLSPLERMLRGALGMPTEPFPRPGQGSGIIIDGERGYVLTNAHMVENATRVGVLLPDRRRFDARVVGSDRLSDVAVVQIPGGDLPTATLGSAADLPIGSWVIAIGNPFGYENSVTVGVVSAKNRQIGRPNGMVLEDLIQTDASINPGNSGGALVDLNGSVVGIPTAIIPYAQGIGFAVSVDVAKHVAEQLIATGEMSWPWVGITHRSLLPEEAESLDVPDRKGTLVVKVVPTGPAARAGLREGDVLLRVGEQRVEDSDALRAVIRSYRPGGRIEVGVWRGGREVTLNVTLGKRPQGPVALAR